MKSTTKDICPSDKEIIDGILKNDRTMIEYLFCKKCSGLINYLVNSMFDNKADTRELVNELFLYIAADNWHKLKLFDYRSSIMRWMTVVATHFFQKKRDVLTEKQSQESLLLSIKETCHPLSAKERQWDVMNALDKMNNTRYRDVILALDFDGQEPREYAKQIGISVDNLYNLHRRALLRLKTIMGKKEDYYD